MVLCAIEYTVYLFASSDKILRSGTKKSVHPLGLRYMYTEVRERCMTELELQGGYCGNLNFVADHQKAFIIVWSLLRLAGFRERRNRLLYLVCFLATVVKTTVSGRDLSTFDMSTWDGCASTDLNHLFSPQRLTVDRSHHTPGPVSNRYVWRIYHILPSIAHS